ncbi:hypothetical protein KY349_01305 [Candidatus Woesearchaeota archaeon]|jgi:predicted PhzF superfamily epimerase YddE/YHI9|nr:hypothetical protein [Candidatus Woesearchaeota archaeon]
MEKVELRFEKVERKSNNGDVVQDLKAGYIHFEVHIDANGKKLVIPKRVRLDKPERMLNKFVTKLKALAEEKYKEAKYYVADKRPPAIDIHLSNEEEVNDKMQPVFDEVAQFNKTGNIAVLATSVVEF